MKDNNRMIRRSAFFWLALLLSVLLGGLAAHAEELTSGTVKEVRVTFWSMDGKTLLSESRVEAGQKITIPKPPAASNLYVLGWNKAPKKNYANYKAGKKLTVTSDLKLFVAGKQLCYTQTFRDQDGKVPDAFAKLKVRCYKNQILTLPDLPAVQGMQALGWSTGRNSSEVQFRQGEAVKITKTRSYYAVYRKIPTYKVTFVKSNGNSNASFQALNRTVLEGASITLPALPPASGYYGKDWYRTVNGQKTTYTPGKTVRIYGNCTLYAHYVKEVKVVLHYNNGDVWKTVAIGKGSSYTLPSMENPEGYTFMGWEPVKGVKLSPSSPRKLTYEAGDKTPKVNSTLHLYAALFQRSTEGSVTYSQLVHSNNGKYSHIIIVGDSRAVRTERTLKRNTLFSDENVSYVAEVGKSIGWLQAEGYTLLKQKLAEVNTDPDKQVAVVITLGVNGVSTPEPYISYLNQLGDELSAQNCRMFFVSVNPCNQAQREKAGAAHRRDDIVRSFNQKLQSGLNSKYTYIDTYSWLMQTGFSTDSGPAGFNNNIDDGLHYAVNTYKRIYLRIIQAVCAA